MGHILNERFTSRIVSAAVCSLLVFFTLDKKKIKSNRESNILMEIKKKIKESYSRTISHDDLAVSSPTRYWLELLIASEYRAGKLWEPGELPFLNSCSISRDSDHIVSTMYIYLARFDVWTENPDPGERYVCRRAEETTRYTRMPPTIQESVRHLFLEVRRDAKVPSPFGTTRSIPEHFVHPYAPRIYLYTYLL